MLYTSDRHSLHDNLCEVLTIKIEYQEHENQ
jgi:hypothetical protein